MVDCLIFSRDRPLQLHALLESIGEHAQHVLRSVTVLVYASGAPFHRGYGHVARSFPGVTFQYQDGFERDVREWLDGAGQYCVFLVDDDLFIRRVSEGILPREREACFALRMECESRSWPWRTAVELDDGYPLALDGHVFRTGEIGVLLDFQFTDPTQFEAGLASRDDRLERPLMAAPAKRYLVGIPANRVSPSSGVPYDGRGDGVWSASALAVAYLDGVRLDRQAMQAELEQATNAHWPAELRFARSTVTA